MLIDLLHLNTEALIIFHNNLSDVKAPPSLPIASPNKFSKITAAEVNLCFTKEYAHLVLLQIFSASQTHMIVT